MKYTLQLNISLPLKRVIELFDNPENWDKWQNSLISYESVDGSPGEPGSRTKLLHNFGKRRVEMIETVNSKSLPDEMVCTYEAPGAWNKVIYRFKEISPEETLWEFESEFNCSGC